MTGTLPTPIEDLLKTSSKIAQETYAKSAPKVVPGQNPWNPFYVAIGAVLLAGGVTYLIYRAEKKNNQKLYYNYGQRSTKQAA